MEERKTLSPAKCLNRLYHQGLPGGASGKKAPAKAGDQERRFDLWVGTIPWRWKWWPTPVLLPGESHGQRSLVGYSPWDRKESDSIEVTNHVSPVRSTLAQGIASERFTLGV